MSRTRTERRVTDEMEITLTCPTTGCELPEMDQQGLARMLEDQGIVAFAVPEDDGEGLMMFGEPHCPRCKTALEITEVPND